MLILSSSGLAPQFPGLLRACAASDTVPLGEGRTVSVNPGDVVFCSFYNAQRNVSAPDNIPKVSIQTHMLSIAR